MLFPVSLVIIIIIIIIITMITRIFSQDIKMSFGLKKCAVMEMRRGKELTVAE